MERDEVEVGDSNSLCFGKQKEPEGPARDMVSPLHVSRERRAKR
jgi:hypothetical protein